MKASIHGSQPILQAHNRALVDKRAQTAFEKRGALLEKKLHSGGTSETAMADALHTVKQQACIHLEK